MEERCGQCDTENEAAFGVECLDCGNGFCIPCAAADDFFPFCVRCRPQQEALWPSSAEVTESPTKRRGRALPLSSACLFCRAPMPETAKVCDCCNWARCSECGGASCAKHWFRCHICDTMRQSRFPCRVRGCRENVCQLCGQFGNALFYCRVHTRRCFFCPATFPCDDLMIESVAHGEALDLSARRAFPHQDPTLARFSNMYCCDGHNAAVLALVQLLRGQGLGFPIIRLIFSYCFKEVYYGRSVCN